MQEMGPQWLDVNELISSLLVPLPFALASLAYGFQSVPRILQDTTTLQELAGSVLEKTTHAADRPKAHSLALAMTCGLTSATLLLMGLKGKLTQGANSFPERRKSHAGITEALERGSIALVTQKIILRVLAVGLPLYATSELGIRVAIMMLVTMASNAMNQHEAFDFNSRKSVSHFFVRRKYAVGAILLQLLSDLCGFTNYRSPPSICLAYLALGISIFILPPPYPSTSPRSSAETSNVSTTSRSSSAGAAVPWGSPSSVEATSSSRRVRMSPLIHTSMDVDLTILGGIVIGLISLLMLFLLRASAGAFSASSMVGFILTPCAGVLALTAVDTTSIWMTKGAGVAVGSLASCIVLVIIDPEWSVFAYQSGLIGISFAATKFDTRAALSLQSRNDSLLHKSESSAAVEPTNMSRFSAFILIHIRGWRLLEQIIMEKDSRRIFYFMW